ncbi:MAG: hypothetical protein L3J45_04810 [Flavobacteriaceae bacterium]|nr:hypothetical protein [Flavobacteriaceae bacterium]
MGNALEIQKKLQAFIIKYYVNALIKGSLLFFVFGVVYFFLILFIEYTLWLKPLARTVLFLSFIAVESALLLFYILFPCFKILGLQKGLNANQASKLIGKHFNKVNDKLLNLVQLQQSNEQTELLLASIEQKATDLLTFKFTNAINFKQNSKYLKFLTIPLLVILLISLSGKVNPFKESLSRVVHYQKPYTPPAPFDFKVLNKSLKIIEGQDLLLKITTLGSITPSQAEININDQNFFLKKDGLDHFSFLVENVTEPFTFYLKSNQVSSLEFNVAVLRKPTVIGFKMDIDYPAYTHRQDITISNTGNITVPEGTKIMWRLQTNQTDTLRFINEGNQAFFISESTDDFRLSKRILKTLRYQVATSNNDLKNFEKLSYTVIAEKDEFPKISVSSDIDSVNFGIAQFSGQISDDYGLRKLELVYCESQNKNLKFHKNLRVKKAIFDTFYFLLDPDDADLDLKKGSTYKFYFKVFDNDAVNGSKFTKSKVFEYYNKTDFELTNATLKAQKNSIDALQNDKQSLKKTEGDLQKITQKLKNQPNFKWNDVKQFQALVERRKKEEELISNHIKNIQNNLNQGKPKNTLIEEKKDVLNKRIEEAKELLKQEKILDELKKLSEKLDKNGLLKRLDKFNQKSKQNKRTLERILELTKRFYIEKKLANISQNLKQLSKEQDSLAKSKENTIQNQDLINMRFEKIKNDLEQLQQENKSLTKPISLPKTNREEFQIKDALKKAQKNLQNKKDKEAVINQKSAAKKMSQMSQKMQQSMMDGEGERNEENIQTLQTILDNLIIFSLDQEDLMIAFRKINDKHPEFSKKLKEQRILKDYFEHIDDSLYTLSLRMPRLSVKIQEEITETHYNINSALKNLAENRSAKGMSNQQYAMTSANNLALILSQMLNQMQNENPSMGKGKKGSKVQSFSLPDIIKKQSKIIQDLKSGIKKGKSGKGNGGDMSAEQYDIYKQQEALRQALETLLKQAGADGSKGDKAKKLMDDLQKQLLDKGFTNSVLQKMTDLQHELLKLEKANLKQGVDKKREATTNTKQFDNRNIKKLNSKKEDYNKTEILNRKPLLLKLPYQKKVQQYFKDSI